MPKFADGAVIAAADGRVSVAELRTDPFGLRSSVAAGGVVALRSDDYRVIGAAFIALDGYAGEVRLLPHGVRTTVDGVVEVSDASVQNVVHHQTALIDPSVTTPVAVAQSDGPTRWSIFTSGTTGAPKRVDHTVGSLTRTTVREPRQRYLWGAIYDPNRMAGLQVLMQVMVSGQQLYAPDRSRPITQQVDEMVAAGVNALSATPSLWRRILQTAGARDLDLVQITLGGEIADQAILNALASAFPAARIVHVFASTETGAAFSVSDGKAGFPTSYLADPPRGIELQIRDGLLWVRSPGVSVADSDGFVCTGDLVEVADERVSFLGRESGLVNVGGTNVAPEAVEAILKSHADVADAVVEAKPNPMTGNVLVASVLLVAGASDDQLSKRLRSWVREHAPTSHVPALVRRVDQIEISATGKAAR